MGNAEKTVHAYRVPDIEDLLLGHASQHATQKVSERGEKALRRYEKKAEKAKTHRNAVATRLAGIRELLEATLSGSQVALSGRTDILGKKENNSDSGDNGCGVDFTTTSDPGSNERLMAPEGLGGRDEEGVSVSADDGLVVPMHLNEDVWRADTDSANIVEVDFATRKAFFETRVKAGQVINCGGTDVRFASVDNQFFPRFIFGTTVDGEKKCVFWIPKTAPLENLLKK